MYCVVLNLIFLVLHLKSVIFVYEAILFLLLFSFNPLPQKSPPPTGPFVLQMSLSVKVCN